MIRTLERMPPGVIGLEAVGRVIDEDYQDVLVPAVRAALERGDVRLLSVLGDEFDSYTAGAVWADTTMFAGRPRGWERLAVVSDADVADRRRLRPRRRLFSHIAAGPLSRLVPTPY